MKRFATVLFTLIICFSLLVPSANAIEWSYEQVIDFIDAIKIDGVQIFTNKQTASYNGPDPNNFFTMKGAVLFWFYDTDHGELYLFNKDNKHLCIWKTTKKKYYNSIMSVLITFLSDYIDFGNGGKITFIITSESNFTSPFIQLEYSTVTDKSGKIYNDPEKFCNEIKDIVNATINSQK